MAGLSAQGRKKIMMGHGQTQRNSKRMMRQRLLPTFVLLGALAATTAGCRTDTGNIQAWGSKSQGPRKLVAVLTHEKYPTDLRIEAALMLVSMKPRGGRRIGIQGTDEQPGLIDALAQMQPAARSAIVSRLVPKLEQEMLKPLPPAQAGQAVTDSTIPYKDAAFALLTHDDGALLADEALRKSMKTTLATWTANNFADRLDDSSQMFGMEQVLRELKADGVRTLPDLIVPGANKIDRISAMIADFGDEQTKARASEKLVGVAKEVNSETWIKQKEPGVEAANKASKLTPTPEQFKAQLAKFQEEELLRVFSSMKKVGGKPVVGFLLAFAQSKQEDPKRRAAALANLQGNLDKKDTAHAAAVLAIAGATDTPDQVREQALQRVGELPRPLVIEKLYELFKDPNWKVRQLAAQLVLKMSETPQLPEFFDKLGKAENMAMTEALRYGALLATMKGTPSPAEVAEKYAASGHPVQDRLAALGYYYNVGTAADVPKIAGYASDNTKTPKCKADAKDCDWKCEITTGKGSETKEVTTLGEFVEYCVKPAMEKNKAAK
jgi:HEAT repeat protein